MIYYLNNNYIYLYITLLPIYKIYLVPKIVLGRDENFISGPFLFSILLLSFFRALQLSKRIYQMSVFDRKATR